MTFGSLFAGIGGFDLGLERAGMECKWQVEIDDYATKVLEKHWPNVKRYRDVREVGAHNLERVDVICGGFPCQDVSNAGKQGGIEAERSGLWTEYIRTVRAIRPRYTIVENVGALATRGLERVLGDFTESGFDAEWATLPASAFGAAHRRERLFIVAYPTGERLEGRITTAGAGEVPVASLDRLHHWPDLSQPLGLRSTDGVPRFMDRISCLGNAVVPHVAEWIGRRIMEVEKMGSVGRNRAD